MERIVKKTPFFLSFQFVHSIIIPSHPECAPADIKKAGAAYDLPIAMGFLGATEQLPVERLPQPQAQPPGSVLRSPRLLAVDPPRS